MFTSFARTQRLLPPFRIPGVALFICLLLMAGIVFVVAEPPTLEVDHPSQFDPNKEMVIKAKYTGSLVALDLTAKPTQDGGCDVNGSMRILNISVTSDIPQFPEPCSKDQLHTVLDRIKYLFNERLTELFWGKGITETLYHIYGSFSNDLVTAVRIVIVAMSAGGGDISQGTIL